MTMTRRERLFRVYKQAPGYRPGPRDNGAPLPSLSTWPSPTPLWPPQSTRVPRKGSDTTSSAQRLTSELSPSTAAAPLGCAVTRRRDPERETETEGACEAGRGSTIAT